MLGAQSIQVGTSSIVVCGGQESMSRVPHAMLMRQGIKMGHGTLTDTMIHDGLTDAFNQYHMGITGNLELMYGTCSAILRFFCFSS